MVSVITGIKILLINDITGNISNSSSARFGITGNLNSDFSGKMDDIRIYNRILDSVEVASLYFEDMCSDTLINDTSLFYVSDSRFEFLSNKIYFESIDSLKTIIGFCDSIIHNYTKYVFQADFFTDTLFVNDTIWHNDTIWTSDTLWVSDTLMKEVIDTSFVTLYDSISITDTLFIDAVLTNVNPPNKTNTLKIYPNPAKDHIFINTGDYNNMSGYMIKIVNQVGVEVFNTYVDELQYKVNLSNWTGKGIYFVNIIDSEGNTTDIRKIILQ